MFFASTQIRDRPPEDGSIPSLAHTCTGLWTVSSFLLVGCVSPTIKVAASVCSIALEECCLLLVFMLLVLGEVEVDVRLEVAVGPLFW